MIETRPPDLKSAILERLDELDIFTEVETNV